MAQAQVCSVCGTEEVKGTCEICGVALCTKHLKVLPVEEKSPASEGTVGAHISPLRPGLVFRKACRKCMMETDWYDREYV